jgi:hypothetical protein
MPLIAVTSLLLLMFTRVSRALHNKQYRLFIAAETAYKVVHSNWFTILFVLLQSDGAIKNL